MAAQVKSLMNILAFDTSSQACSIALRSGEMLRVHHQIAPMQHAKLILSLIQDLLVSCSLKLDDLDMIAYGKGPGSFTGNRIAACTAQGLGFAINKPIVAISSLAAIAQTVHLEKQAKHYFVAVDAHHQGQIYWARYDSDETGRVVLQGEESLCLPQALERLANPTMADSCGLGDAWEKYRNELIERVGFEPSVIDPTQLPNALGILALVKGSL